ncbi:MAG: hypothetical protein LBH22_02350, partial [Bacteroidales bacterium]|nr:hypothetical protein [Bacteroidales bacterium]
MKIIKNMKIIKYSIVGLGLLIGLNQTVSAQHLYGQMVINENPKLLHGNLTKGSSAELFLGDHGSILQKTNELWKVGNFRGEVGAKLHISVIDNSNDFGTRGLFNIIGTANGSTEIVLDIHNSWNGMPIDLVRAYNAGSDVEAFTMQEATYNGREAYLANRLEGGDRVWFLAERTPCLPLIVQKRNNTLVVNNNPESNGGFNFIYYKWYRNDVLIHEG